MPEVSNNKKQNKNKYQKRTYTLNGETKTLSEWSDLLDINYNLLASRWRRNIPAEIALSKHPVFEVLENGRALIYKGNRRVRGFYVGDSVKSANEIAMSGDYKISQLEKAWDQNRSLKSIETRRKIEIVNKNNSTKRPEYLRWCGLKARCLQKSNNRYYLYGGRGIKVYEPWIKDFWAFLEHIGEMPGPQYTVDRLDPEKGYEPGNVRWLHKNQQSGTRRITLTATMNGEKKTLKEWAAQYGIVYETLRERLSRGWSIEEALTKERRGSGSKSKKQREKGGV